MRALLIREINAFFNSLTAYVVMAVFLLTTGLFIWVFPTDFNVLESGHAGLDGLFVVGPFVFLFLIPAICMRFFAEEVRSGTMEMLRTKPITDLQIVMAKYLAGVLLVVISLLPTLIYLVSVVIFSSPPGVDMGGVWGSYLGLVFLGMVFVALGMLASAITDNQVVAFILAFFLCGFLFFGFELIHSLEMFGQFGYFLKELGLYAHYTSMGRGVIDSRDVLYFLGVVALCVILTRQFVLGFPLQARHVKQMVMVLGAVVVLNALGMVAFKRMDLTSENRYSLTPSTRNMLSQLDDIVYFRVFLDGDLPAEFRQLRSSTRETLDEFRAWSDMVRVEFINPSQAAGSDPDDIRSYHQYLMEQGLEPTQVQMRSGDGSSQRVVFPGALVTHAGREVPVHFLEDNMGLGIQEMMHNSALMLEYNLASAIRQLAATEREKVGFLEGNGELTASETASITALLSRFYHVERIRIEGDYANVKDFRTLISAGPTGVFSSEDKLVLDQFLMGGGSMLWLIDPVVAHMDSLAGPTRETLGIARNINRDDFFFRYGVRLNPVLVQDMEAAPIPVTTGFVGDRPQINLLPWPFFPLVTPRSDHPVVSNLNLIRTEFVSSLDTVEAPGVRKEVLLSTSPYSRVMPVPVRISLDLLQQPLQEALYNQPPQPVAVLLEGGFESLYRNRVLPGASFPEGFEIMEESVDAAMVVVADGSMMRNQVGPDGRPLPLGYDRYSRQQFGNGDFLLNAVNYLSGDADIMAARSKDLRMRLLDAQRVRNHRVLLQLLNVVLPVVLVMLFGFLRLWWRTRKFAQ